MLDPLPLLTGPSRGNASSAALADRHVGIPVDEGRKKGKVAFKNYGNAMMACNDDVIVLGTMVTHHMTL